MNNHLVQLVEVPQDDLIILELWENFLPHLPPPLDFLVPAEPLQLRVRRTLSMIAAEKRVASENYVLRVYPVALRVLADTLNGIVDVDIPPSLPEHLGGHCCRVGVQVVAPFRAEGPCEPHEPHLYRCWPGSEHLVTCTSGEPVEIDQDMYAVLHDLLN